MNMNIFTEKNHDDDDIFPSRPSFRFPIKYPNPIRK